MEPLSKAGVESDGSITWQTGDKIAVLLDNGDVASLTLESGEGTTSATFTGEIPSARTFAGKAAYPWWDGAWSSSAGELVLSLPESIAFISDSYVPAVMKATASGESLPFAHVGAIMQFTIKNLPSSVAGFTFSTSAGAVMGRNDFSYTFNPGTSTRVFHIPVNAGTLPSYTISLKDVSGGVFLSKTKSSTTSVERCDFRVVKPLQVNVDDKFRILCYNVCDGMVRDSDNNFDSFVAWVRSQAPDVMVLCEAHYKIDEQNKGDLDAIASRWGHGYTAKVSKDAYPIVVTSSHPITVEQTLTSNLVHGAIHISVAGYDVVGLHLRPTLDDDESGVKEAEEYAKYGSLRKTELEYILSQTFDNTAYSSRTNWIFAGDFNAYSPLEKTAVSPYDGKAAYAYSEPTASVCYEVYPLIANSLKDVIYYKGGTAFKPSMYHGRSRLDYIFATEGIYSRVGVADVIRGGFPGDYRNDDANPSDHLPLYMDIVTFAFKVLDGYVRMDNWDEEDLITEQ
ncbi:MAG: hypothetical protein K6A64_03275 [Bacteroidales bacterium]|nr:hypothetical protein [Bacteroidales bacterium]